MHKEWIEGICRCVHESFEGEQPFNISYLFTDWNYTRKAKIKCREDLADFLYETDADPVLWTIFRHRLELKQCKSTTRALQLTLQEAWCTDTNKWLDIF